MKPEALVRRWSAHGVKSCLIGTHSPGVGRPSGSHPIPLFLIAFTSSSALHCIINCCQPNIVLCRSIGGSRSSPIKTVLFLLQSRCMDHDDEGDANPCRQGPVSVRGWSQVGARVQKLQRNSAEENLPVHNEENDPRGRETEACYYYHFTCFPTLCTPPRGMKNDSFVRV